MPPTVDQRLKDLTTGVSDLTKGLSDVRSELTRVTERQTSSVKEVRDMIAGISGQVASVSDHIRKLEEHVAGLAGSILSTPFEQPAVRPSIALNDLAQQLRDSVDAFNKQTKDSPSPVVMDGLEVEIKTGFDVSGKTKLCPPLPQELKPEGLSVLRFTLRPMTPMKFAD